MIKNIYHQGELLAFCLYRDYKADGVKFLTDDQSILQVGYMHHPKNHKIKPHRHQAYKRVTSGTQEVLFIKKGKVLAKFYDLENKLVENITVSEGDALVLLSGAHSFEVLETAEIIEVKNGPFAGEKDKIRFEVNDTCK